MKMEYKTERNKQIRETIDKGKEKVAGTVNKGKEKVEGTIKDAIDFAKKETYKVIKLANEKKQEVGRRMTILKYSFIPEGKFEDLNAESEATVQKKDVNKLEDLLKQVEEKGPRTFLGRIYMLAKIDYLRDVVKSHENVNNIDMDREQEISKEQETYLEEQDIIKQQIFEIKKKLVLKNIRIERLAQELENASEEEKNSMKQGGLNNRLGWLRKNYADLSETLTKLDERSAMLEEAFEKTLKDINKKYDMELLKNSAKPIANIFGRVFGATKERVGSRFSKIAGFVQNRREQHKQNQERKQEAFAKAVATRREESNEFLQSLLFDESKAPQPARAEGTPTPEQMKANEFEEKIVHGVSKGEGNAR